MREEEGRSLRAELENVNSNEVCIIRNLGPSLENPSPSPHGGGEWPGLVVE